MLDFFRKYQRILFAIITLAVIFSFLFFGAFSTFGSIETVSDRKIGAKIDGSPLYLSEVKSLSRFLSTDVSHFSPKNPFCNLSNDGVIEKDFFKTSIAQLLVNAYLEELKPDLTKRIERIQRYRPYTHPQAPILSVKTVWEHWMADAFKNWSFLESQKEVNHETFASLIALYQAQTFLSPDLVRQVLVSQQRQYPQISFDRRLLHEDLSLFGFHSLTDWFGPRFLDLVSEFILNVAASAEKKGYKVSLEEAKGDLLHQFQTSLKTLARFQESLPKDCFLHLRSLGFEEKKAVEIWRKILLCRRYFQDIGTASFLDKLAYRDFGKYAQEEVVVQMYHWPIVLQTAQDLANWEFYLKAISSQSKNGIVEKLCSLEEVENRFPELVQTRYRGIVQQVSLQEVALKLSLKELWKWQTEEIHFSELQKEFSLPKGETAEDRFSLLEKLGKQERASIDVWSRRRFVEEHPEWIEEALSLAPKQEKTWTVDGKGTSSLEKEGTFIKIESQQIQEPKRIVTFQEAKDWLSLKVPKAEGPLKPEKNPFLSLGKEVFLLLQKDPNDPHWIQSGSDPLIDQCKFASQEVAIPRNSKESWMKEKAFFMLPDTWSQVHVAEDGQIVFFYLKEKKATAGPILDQLLVGKETLAADAKAFAAEKLMEKIKEKQAIVIPTQKEEE